MTELDIKAHLPKILQDKAQFLSDTELLFFTKQAILQFNKDRPKIEVWEFEGNGESYIFELPSSFNIEFSRILSVEYPANTQPPNFLNCGDFQIVSKYVDNNLKHFLCFKWITPSKGNLVRVTYTSLREDNEELPDEYFTAVCYLAASYAFKSLAARFAASKDPILSADIVDYRDKVRTYLELASEAEKIYRLYIPKPKIHQAFTDWDMEFSNKFGPFFFHKPSSR